MKRDVSYDLAKLTGLSGGAALGIAAVWQPLAGLFVAVGMLALLTIALVSPAGPDVEFDDTGAMSK